MIIAYGLFIFGFVGFLGSIEEGTNLINMYSSTHEIPIKIRVFFHVILLVEVLLMLCSAQYIWG